MKKICKFFGIEKLGWLEFMIALYPIVSMYTYGMFKLFIFLPLIIDIVLIVLNRRKICSYDVKPLYILLGYMLLHFLMWILMVPDLPSYFYNSHFSFFLMLVSLIIILPHIDFSKLCSSVNLLSILCALGLVYHAFVLLHSSTVSPIPLFFMPSPDSTSRLYGEINRPLSFFAEPQSYVSYMIIPLFLALTRKNLVWAILISLTILMSGSTTGIVMILVMFSVYILTTRVGVFYRILLVCALVALGSFLVSSEFAATGLEKMENTDLNRNARTANGFIVASTVPLADFIFGVPYANVSDYCHATGNAGGAFLDSGDSVFLPAFWIALLQYGIFGLIFYLGVYFNILKRDKTVLSYWLCIVIALFSNPDFLGSNFVFMMIFCYTFVYQRNNENNMYAHNAVRQ